MAKTKAKRVGDFSLRADARRGTRDDGRQYHRIVKYEGGKEITAWSGWATPAEAQKQAAGLIVNPEIHAPTQSEIETIADLCECFLGETEGDTRESTHRIQRTRLKFVVEGLGDVLVSRFRLTDLEGYVRRRKSVIASGTIWLEVRYLRQAWAWAVARGHIPDRECPDLSVKPGHQQGYTPTDAEIYRVLEVFRKRGGWRYLAVLLLVETGARLGEIANLKRKDIDREKMLIRVDGKTGKREIPIAGEVYAEIRPCLLGDPDGWLFGVKPGAIASLGATRCENFQPFSLERACELAGVERFTCNALRRAFTIRCYQAGVDPALEASLAGHSIQTALTVYRQVKPTEQRQAIERISLTRGVTRAT